MDPLRLLAETQGFFTRADARHCGYDDRAVTRAVRVELWHRIRRGAYTFTDLWSGLDDIGRHRVRSHVVAGSLGHSAALSHVSGAIDHGLLVWGIDLSRVHVTRLDGGPGRIEGDVVHHEGKCTDAEVQERHDHLVLSPVRCALETASRAGNEQALVVLDSLLYLELADFGGLMRRFEQMGSWPYTQHLHLVVRMADGGAQTVGESRGRYLFWTFRIPAPKLQFEVYNGAGELIGIADWGWPEHALLGEFDGRIKYGRLLKPGQQAGDVVFAEKQREDAMREATGMAMVRLVWADYDRPRATASRIERLLRRAG